MKNLFLGLIFIGFSISQVYSQAAGEITHKGVTYPRYATAPTGTVAVGTMYYNTTTQRHQYWDGYEWTNVAGQWYTIGKNIYNTNQGFVNINSPAGMNTNATFGLGGKGISIQKNFPSIGFNTYPDTLNVQRYMGGGGYGYGNTLDTDTGILSWNKMGAGSGYNPVGTSEKFVMGLSQKNDFWVANNAVVSNDPVLFPPTAPVSGQGTRMMWIPSRSAFRVGTVVNNGSTQSNFWDANNIGLFSFASGFNTRASGTNATAMGYESIASGVNSTALGRNGYAPGVGSTAMGQYTSAVGEASTAMGAHTLAVGNYSTTMGTFTQALVEASTALGTYNTDFFTNGLFMVGNGTALNPKTVFIITKDNSRVGIGTETPIAPLHVAGFNSNTISLGNNYTLFNAFSSTVGHGSTGTPAFELGIYSESGIASGTFIAALQNITASDTRIKNIKGLSNNAKDLAKLKQIEITDYTMKDEVTWGSKNFKKVIAQQVESVYPEVVSLQTKVIPDIYALAQKVAYNAATKELTVSMAKNYELKVGDKVELVHPEKGKVQSTVTSISGNAFTVRDWLYETDKIFVFGREVSDFRTVDYDALSMLGISAIQALAKENEELRAKSVKADVRSGNLEARLEKLESLLNYQSIVETNKTTSNK